MVAHITGLSLTFLSFSSHAHIIKFLFLSYILLDICVTLVVPLIASFLVSSFSVTLRIRLKIPIAFISIVASCLCCCPTFSAVQHCWSDCCVLDLPLQLHWQLSVAQHSTAFLAISSTTDPTYLKCVTNSNSFPNTFTVCMPISSFRTHLMSMNWVFRTSKPHSIFFKCVPPRIHVICYVYHLSTTRRNVISRHNGFR